MNVHYSRPCIEHNLRWCLTSSTGLLALLVGRDGSISGAEAADNAVVVLKLLQSLKFELWKRKMEGRKGPVGKKQPMCLRQLSLVRGSLQPSSLPWLTSPFEWKTMLRAPHWLLFLLQGVHDPVTPSGQNGQLQSRNRFSSQSDRV